MFETELFKCFLVLSIDLGVDSPFYDVTKSKIPVYYLSYVRVQPRMKGTTLDSIRSSLISLRHRRTEVTQDVPNYVYIQ